MEASSGRGFPLLHHLLIALPMYGLYAAFYFTAQSFPQAPITLVPHTQWDHQIALDVSWIWIYLIAYAYVPIVFLFLKQKKTVYLYAFSYLIISIISVTVFMFYPTTLPRESFPTDTSFAGLALDWLRGLDQPTNCLPSLHVATAWQSSWWLYQEKKWPGILGFIFSALVVWSTLAVKQHVVWDAITGSAVAVIAIILSYLLNRYIFRLKF
tara:strand:+ start:37462 stop:38094 length:633 start_codon:yes stop_codon:yes gene_type:complete